VSPVQLPGKALPTSSDLTIRDAATGREVNVLKGHTGMVMCAAWSPDAIRLASGSLDNTARVWDASTGNNVAVLKGHDGSVVAVAWNKDGSRLVTTSRDGMIRLWSAEGVELVRLAFFEKQDWIAMLPDGTYTGSPDAGKYLLWRVWDANGKSSYQPAQSLQATKHQPDEVRRALK
jgi:WD40 repeat protein